MSATIRVLSLLVLFTIFCLTHDQSCLGVEQRPNIILIFVDDMGYGDLGCYGNQVIRTPNIDRLAAKGQRWTSFYAAGNYCVPSRRGLMSGRHPGLLKNVPLRAARNALLPAMLKSEGYRTALLGKWHLAGYPQDFPNAPMHPLNCGFDFYFGTPGSNDAPGPPKQTIAAFDTATSLTWKIPLYEGRKLYESPADQTLFTQRYTAHAVQWIKQHSHQPFFLYLAHNMPHVPIFASDEFRGRSPRGVFGDVVEEIDWSVGQIVAAVEEADISQRTLIVFTSDNGPWTAFGPRHAGTALPLRGEKGTSWEGGSRVPGIFSWPGKIAPGVVDGIGVNLDLFATFAQLIGASKDVPSDKPGWMSIDLSATLLDAQPSPRTEWYYNRFSFRSGKYKLHVGTQHPTDPIARKRTPPTMHASPLLFDLEADIGEQTNIAADNPDVVERLLDRMQAIQE